MSVGMASHGVVALRCVGCAELWDTQAYHASLFGASFGSLSDPGSAVPIPTFAVTCIHTERNDRPHGPACPQCLEPARDRLQALARGSVALSLSEALPDRGYAGPSRSRVCCAF